jgi:PAT family beta-lactamase induction signal transducer AmpG
MALTLLGMAFRGNITSNLNAMAWMFFFHNCFASLQDVSTDALAIDIFPDDERGQVNGFMWGSKIIGVGFGISVMGTFLVHTSLNITVIFQSGLILGVMMFPLLFRERDGEKLLPWTVGKSMIGNHLDTIRKPMSVVKDLLKGFTVQSTFSALCLFLSLLLEVVSVALFYLYCSLIIWAGNQKHILRLLVSPALC